MAYFGSDRDDKTVKKKNAKSKGEVIVSSIKNNRNKWIAGALAVVILIAAYSCAAGGRSGAGGGQESEKKNRETVRPSRRFGLTFDLVHCSNSSVEDSVS